MPDDIDPTGFLTDNAPPVVVDPPNPEPNPEPKQKDKPTQIAELRRAKEAAEKAANDAKKEAEKLRKELEEVSAFKPLEPVTKYLKDKFGDVNEESVNKFIEKNRERKNKLTETEKALQEREKQIEDLDIEYSDDWKKGFVEPIKKTQSSLVAKLGTFDRETKRLRHPELFEGLLKTLIQTDKDGNPLSSLEIKGILVSFEDEYKKRTGEDWEMPNLTHVTEDVENLVGKMKAAASARMNWSKAKEEREKDRLFTQAKQQEENIKKEIANRDYLTRKVITEYPIDFDDVVDKDAFVEDIEDSNNYLKGLLTRDKNTKPKQYTDLLVDMAKAKHFDNVVTKYRELQEEVKKLREENKGTIPHGGSRAPKPGQPKATQPSDNPTSFLED